MKKVRTKVLGLALFALLCSSLGGAQSVTRSTEIISVILDAPSGNMACTLPLPKKPKFWTGNLCFFPDR